LNIYEIKVFIDEVDFNSVFEIHHYSNSENATNKFHDILNAISNNKYSLGNLDYRIINQDEINNFIEENDDDCYRNKGINKQGIIEESKDKSKDKITAYYFIDADNYETMIGDYIVLKIQLKKVDIE